jgi:hypothetical protein
VKTLRGNGEGDDREPCIGAVALEWLDGLTAKRRRRITEIRREAGEFGRR